MRARVPSSVLCSVPREMYAARALRSPEIGRTIIRHPLVDLRPNETASLDSVALLTAREEREAIACKWRATATNVSGRVQRTMSLPVPGAGDRLSRAGERRHGP